MLLLVFSISRVSRLSDRNRKREGTHYISKGYLRRQLGMTFLPTTTIVRDTIMIDINITTVIEVRQRGRRGDRHVRPRSSVPRHSSFKKPSTRATNHEVTPKESNDRNGKDGTSNRKDKYNLPSILSVRPKTRTKLKSKQSFPNSLYPSSIQSLDGLLVDQESIFIGMKEFT